MLRPLWHWIIHEMFTIFKNLRNVIYFNKYGKSTLNSAQTDHKASAASASPARPDGVTCSTLKPNVDYWNGFNLRSFCSHGNTAAVHLTRNQHPDFRAPLRLCPMWSWHSSVESVSLLFPDSESHRTLGPLMEMLRMMTPASGESSPVLFAERLA